jgi:hypothetical protein
MSKRPFLTATEIDADPTILRRGKAEQEKQRNRSGQRAGISKLWFSGPFAGRLIEMLDSPAYRVLSLSAHRMLARLEIELARHGGKPEENGNLPCTYADFVKYGISRNEIGPARRELVALGFIEVTHKGSAGNADQREATQYLLTYLWAGSDARVSDGWRRIKTVDEAHHAARNARAAKGDARARDLGRRGAMIRWKNKIPVMESIPTPVTESIPKKSLGRTKTAKSPVTESIPPSIFSLGGAVTL